MKYSALIAATAALSLAACSESETPAPDATASESAAATEAAAPAADGAVALAAGAAPTKEYIVGKWGEAPDCTLPMTFNPDGSITDGPANKWTLTGNTLDLEGFFKMTLTVIDKDKMEAVNEGGGKTTLMRCS